MVSLLGAGGASRASSFSASRTSCRRSSAASLSFRSRASFSRTSAGMSAGSSWAGICSRCSSKCPSRPSRGSWPRMSFSFFSMGQYLLNVLSQEGTVHRKTKKAQPAAGAASAPPSCACTCHHAPTQEQGIPAGSPRTVHPSGSSRPAAAALPLVFPSSSRPAGERSFFIFRCAVPLGSTMIRVHRSAFTSLICGQF